ncbi:MAG: ABC transporter permease [Microbacterium sp.]
MLLTYIARRVLYAVFVVWAAFTLAFLALFALPSDAVEILLGEQETLNGDSSATIDPEIADVLRARYGLDRPPLVQYLIVLGGFLRGDFGVSMRTGIPVLQTLGQSIPWTLQLALVGLVISLALGVAIAVAAVSVRNPWLRQTISSLPALGASLPVFWIGIVLIQLFSFQLGWFPAMGYGGLDTLVLPLVAIALPGAAGYAQVLIKGLADTRSQPFVDVVRAKGASEGRILWRHVFRNATIPTLTMVGMTVGNLLSGSVVIETVFSRDGLGRLTQTAVNGQDTPVVLAVVVLSAAVTAAVNLIVDLLYPLIDPRIATPGVRAS